MHDTRRSVQTLLRSRSFWVGAAVNAVLVLPATAWLDQVASTAVTTPGGETIAAVAPWGVIILYALALSLAVTSVVTPLSRRPISVPRAILSGMGMLFIQGLIFLVVGSIVFALLTQAFRAQFTALIGSAVAVAVTSIWSAMAVVEAVRTDIGKAFRSASSYLKGGVLKWLGLGAAIYAVSALLWWPPSLLWPKYSLGDVWWSGVSLVWVISLFALATTLHADGD